MKRIATLICLLVSGLALAWPEGAEKPEVVDLWPGKVPGDDAAKIGAEKFFELKVAGKPYQVGGKPTRWLTNVTKPTLTVYRPAKSKDTGAAMPICPAGATTTWGWMWKARKWPPG